MLLAGFFFARLRMELDAARDAYRRLESQARIREQHLERERRGRLAASKWLKSVQAKLDRKNLMVSCVEPEALQRAEVQVRRKETLGRLGRKSRPENATRPRL